MNTTKSPDDRLESEQAMDPSVYAIKDQLIVDVRPLTDREAVAEGWHLGGRIVLALVLNNGVVIYPACDPEGNDVGTLFAKTRTGEAFYLGA